MCITLKLRIWIVYVLCIDAKFFCFLNCAQKVNVCVMVLFVFQSRDRMIQAMKEDLEKSKARMMDLERKRLVDEFEQEKDRLLRCV